MWDEHVVTVADKVPVIDRAPSLSFMAKLKRNLWEDALIGDKQKWGGLGGKRPSSHKQIYRHESDVLDHLLTVCLTD